jgi:hypothetical protein
VPVPVIYDAAYAAVRGGAHAATLKQCADIIRDYYPRAPRF